MTPDQTIAAIAIGRNEGARLDACLASLAGSAERVIYVDSGSTDDSLAIASRYGAEIVSLDMSQPFTAARARNAGFERLRAMAGTRPPGFVQFIDGDCTLDSAWLDSARQFLNERADVAIAAGRRRERFPDASIFNRLCDIEWATPIGPSITCGGDFIIRYDAFVAVDGFNDRLIAGEEPDLCFRLREKGWLVWRLDEEMTQHDAAINRVGQWWSRAKRAGYAFANGHALHGRSPEKFWQRETRRAILFGGIIPIAGIVGALVIHPAVLGVFLIYPVQALRTYLGASHVGSGRTAWALACVAGRFPEFHGVAKYWQDRLTGRSAALIEYK